MVAAMASAASPVWAQSFCDEPDDPDYADRMLRTRAAVEVEDFELALEHLLWAADHFDFAIIDFSIARSYHRLERYQEASEAYTQFLRHFEGCQDDQGLADAARQYRAIALQEYTLALNTSAESVPPGEDGVPEEVPPEDASVSEAPELDEPGGVAVAEVQTEEDRQAFPEEEDSGIHPAWWIIGSGGALVASGLVIELANLDLLDRREEALTSNPSAVPELNDRVARARPAERVLVSVGAVATISGFIYLLVDNRGPSEDEAPAATITPRQSGVFIELSGSF